MAFKLRSGNGIPFKQMGSSPAKQEITLGKSFGNYNFKTQDDSEEKNKGFKTWEFYLEQLSKEVS